MYSKKSESPRGIENASITGLRFPNRVLTLSEKYPIKGLKIAFQIAPTALIIPAFAGSTFATVVRKNIKKVPINV